MKAGIDVVRAGRGCEYVCVCWGWGVRGGGETVGTVGGMGNR